jgi:hypothetical protein
MPGRLQSRGECFGNRAHLFPDKGSKLAPFESLAQMMTRNMFRLIIRLFGMIYSTAVLKVKVKLNVKVALEQATKAQRWSTGIALLFL